MNFLNKIIKISILTHVKQFSFTSTSFQRKTSLFSLLDDTYKKNCTNPPPDMQLRRSPIVCNEYAKI